MKWLTLGMNPPEQIRAIIGKKENVFGYSPSYHIVDFCGKESSVDKVINELQSHSMTMWKYIEGEDSE